MDRLNPHTPDRAADNYRRLAELFPNAVTETITGYDEKGRPIIERAIDADVLQQEIDVRVVAGPAERYRFTWPDKRRAMLTANAPIDLVLRPCREESVDFDNTENLYIEGDNLDVLKLLRETYQGRIKMIYIDPPYNTGGDFVYEDDFTQRVDDYLANSGQFDAAGNRLVRNTESNGRFHTDWLNMMYPRLQLARDLLRNDGAIFISIDDNEAENLRKICNEIFGEANFVAEIPWQSRASVQNDTDFSINHEYICVYAKRRRRENRRLKETNAGQWYSKDSFVCRPLPLNIEKFDNPDNDPRGPWKADPLDAPHIRPNLTYPITNPITGEDHLPPRGRCWRFFPEKFQQALADGRIVWTNGGLGRPQLKVFYSEKRDFGSVDNSWFSAERVGTATRGTKELMQLFGGESYFETPKPVSLPEKLIDLAGVDGDDIVLDFFSGSAATAHAVMRLNAADGGRRRFIMVQLQEETPPDSAARRAGFRNVCELGKERIRRAAGKIAEEHPEALFDGGFRVLKCDSANMKDVCHTPDDTRQEQLDLLADNIKPDRTPEDLLFQAMLRLGVPLSSSIETTEVAGKKLFVVGGDLLLACFDASITDEVIAAAADRKPRCFVMRDSSMADDTVAENFEQIFRSRSPDTMRTVL